MNLWFTFFVWFAWNVHASFVIILTDQSNRFRQLNLWLCGVENWRMNWMHFNYFVFLFSLSMSFHYFCSCVDLLWNRVDNLSLFVWFFILFTDSPQVRFVWWDFYFEWFSCASLQLDPIFEGVQNIWATGMFS